MEKKEKDPRIIELRINLGNQIREIRNARKMTLKELAQRLDITEGTLSKVENGIWVSIDMLFKISLELGFKIKLYP